MGDQIEDLLLDYYDIGKFNGSVLVVSGGEVIYENFIGYADFDQKLPLTGNTPFYIASISKQFTSSAIMLLIQQGKLSFDRQIRFYLPYLPKAYNAITIHHLLTHTSGVPDYLQSNEQNSGFTNEDVLQFVMQRRNPEFEAGSKFKYSNSGYVLLAMIVQIVSGQRFEDFMKVNFFEPLGMEDTFVATERTDAKVAKGYDEKGKLDDYTLLTMGDGGIYSTAKDLYKWQQNIAAGSIVKRDMLEKAFNPINLENGSQRRYGYGWELGEDLSGPFIYHSGGLNGFRTYLEQDLSLNEGIIILSNNSSDRIVEIRNIITKILNNKPYELPSSK